MLKIINKNCFAPATQHQRLLSRIHRRYRTFTQEIRLGSLRFDFTSVAEPNLVLDEVAAREAQRARAGAAPSDSAEIPYWAELWDSARGLASTLCEFPLNSNTHVLDLGCGMGLVGSTAAAAGARVLLADVAPTALLFARLNTLPFTPRPRTRRLDWRRDQLNERFDLIAGADILYEKSQWEFLHRFWSVHLAENGTILLGEPGRQSGDLFIPWIQNQGWTLEQSSHHDAKTKKTIRIFKMRIAK